MKEYQLGTTVLEFSEWGSRKELIIRVASIRHGHVTLSSIPRKDLHHMKGYTFHVQIVVALLNYYRKKWEKV